MCFESSGAGGNTKFRYKGETVDCAYSTLGAQRRRIFLWLVVKCCETDNLRNIVFQYSRTSGGYEALNLRLPSVWSRSGAMTTGDIRLHDVVSERVHDRLYRNTL